AFHDASKRRKKYEICFGKGFKMHFCIETCHRQKHLRDAIGERVREDGLCRRNMIVI
ncbi:hypothetical protein TorRG33x02_190690, partial [Trema orientale]